MSAKLSFSTLDYALFGGMMFLSFLIGVYYGFIRKTKQNTTQEYLLGSKGMKVWPTAISLTATWVFIFTSLCSNKALFPKHPKNRSWSSFSATPHYLNRHQHSARETLSTQWIDSEMFRVVKNDEQLMEVHIFAMQILPLTLLSARLTPSNMSSSIVETI